MNVTIFAAETPRAKKKTTSCSGLGSFWFPYDAEPTDKVIPGR